MNTRIQCDNQIPGEDPIQKKLRNLKGEAAWLLQRTAGLVDEARAVDRLVLNLERLIFELQVDLEERGENARKVLSQSS